MAEEGCVIACHTMDGYKKQMQQANEAKKLVVIEFAASWCGPCCRIIAPKFAELAKKYPQVVFLKIDVDALNAVAEEWKIEVMPNFIFVKEGNKIDEFVGAKKEEIQKKIELHAVDQEPEKMDPEIIDKRVRETEKTSRKPEKMDWEPDKMDREPNKTGREPEKTGREPEKTDPKPDKMVREPEKTGRKPEKVVRATNRKMYHAL